MNAQTTNRIGIAVVESQRQFLIGVRDVSSSLAGCHEFPGGKCEPRESPSDCAVRECREETGLEVCAIEELLYVEHTYEHANVQLHFWLCQPAQNEPELSIQNHQGFRWIPVEQLPELQFPEANTPLIELLLQRYSPA